jgi:hypothetical protein
MMRTIGVIWNYLAEPVWWPAYALLFMLLVIAVVVWLGR